MTLTSLQHWSHCRSPVFFCSCIYAIIDIDVFDSHNAIVTHNAFQWAGQLQKLPRFMGISTALLIHGFLGPHESAVYKRHLGQFSAVFAGLTNVTNRHTDHATPSVAIGRIWLFAVMWP